MPMIPGIHALPLAQSGSEQILTLIISAVVLIFFSIIVLMIKRYKRCPSNKILVIYGKTGEGSAKCLHGGSAFVIPLFQDYDFLNLDPIQIEVPLKRRPVHREHPRQRAQRLHRGHWHRPGHVMQNAADPPARPARPRTS